jgi:hypothetical protein
MSNYKKHPTLQQLRTLFSALSIKSSWHSSTILHVEFHQVASLLVSVDSYGSDYFRINYRRYFHLPPANLTYCFKADSGQTLFLKMKDNGVFNLKRLDV